MKQRYKVLLRYNGTRYEGWQRQKNSENSIQAHIERVITTVFNDSEPIKCVASGRTDAGVHAFGQVVHFESAQPTPEKLVHRLNQMLPADIAVRRIWQAPSEFHALRSSELKTYKYILNLNRDKNCFSFPYSWRPRVLPIAISDLNQMAQVLVGEHDFSSFQTKGTPVLTPVRQIHEAYFTPSHTKHVIFTISGNGFLKQMVRNIVGTLTDIASSTSTPNKAERLLEILEAKDRQAAGSTAAPQGLLLFSVKYPKDLDFNCRRL